MSPNFFRLAAVAIMMAAQSAGLLAVFWNTRSAAEGESQIRSESLLIAESAGIGRAVRNQLGTVESVLSATFKLLESGSVSTDELGSTGITFAQQLVAQGDIESIFVGRPDGGFVGASRIAGGFRVRETLPTDNGRTAILTVYDQGLRYQSSQFSLDDRYDPRERPWYTLAVTRADAPVWTEAYRDAADGKLGITAARAWIGPQDRLTGVLGVDSKLSNLSERVLARLKGSDAEIIIIDSSGQIVASSHPSTTAAQAMLESVGAQLGSDESWQSLRAATLVSAGDTAGSDDVRGSFRYAPEADRVTLVAPLNLGDQDLGWSVLMTTSVSGAMFASDAEVARFIIALAAIVVVPPLLALPVLLWLSGPLRRLVRSATIDDLTGAISRAEFLRRLQDMLLNRRGSDESDQLVVIALDLDGFKPINDKHGHPVGDEVLKGFAERLRVRVRPGDLVGRMGGDEFMVALRIDRSVSAFETADRICASVVRRAFPTQAGRLHIGATAGVARHNRGESIAALLARADQALIIGKAKGKNRVYLAAPAHDTGPGTSVDAMAGIKSIRTDSRGG